ncbi:MAG: DUF3488 and DUF4129 domain-containing transglutaminase family protein [Planctomycetota bacterium]
MKLTRSSKSPGASPATSRWREPLSIGFGSRVAMALAGMLAAFCSTAVFVGTDKGQLLEVYPMAVGAVLVAVIYLALDPGAAGASLFRRVAAMVVVGLLLIATVAIFMNDVTSNRQLTPVSAARVSLPFCVFMALAGNGLFELVFLFGVCAMTYLAGVWCTVQGPDFVSWVVVGVAAAILMLALGLIRHDVMRYRRQGRERVLLGLEPPKVRGRYPIGSWVVVLVVLIGLSLSTAAALFMLLPRPGAPDAAAGNSGDGSAVIDGETIHLPGGAGATGNRPPITSPGDPSSGSGTNPAGGAGAVGLTESVNNDRVGHLLRTPTPMYSIRVLRNGAQTDAVSANHIYLRSMVLDYFDGRRWSVSPAAADRWLLREEVRGVPTPLGASILPDSPPRTEQARRLMARLGLSQSDGAGRHVRIFEFTPLTAKPEATLPMPDLTMLSSLRLAEYNSNLGLLRRIAPSRIDANVWRQRVGEDQPGELEENGPFVMHALDFPERDWRSLVEGEETTSWAGDSCRQLPPALDPAFARLAAELMMRARELIGREAVTAFDRVELVMAWLQPENGFSYTLDLPPIPPGMTGLQNFLFNTHRGHCELFASAAAVLLRQLRVSTRVVGGYCGADVDARNNRYIVRGAHAHLWFEVLYRDYGWFPYDPTPRATRNDLVDQVARGEIVDDPAEYMGTAGAQPPQQAVITPDNTNVPSPAAGANAPPGADDPTQSGSRNLVGAFSTDNQRELWRELGAWLGMLGPVVSSRVAIVLAVVLVVALVMMARRRRRVRKVRDVRRQLRPVDPALRVSWYEQLLDLLMRFGLSRRPSETPQEFALKVRNRLGELGDPFCALTDWYQLLRYAGARLEPDQQQQLQQVRGEFISALQLRQQARATATAAAAAVAASEPAAQQAAP